jgi:hypothetical protein
MRARAYPVEWHDCLSFDLNREPLMADPGNEDPEEASAQPGPRARLMQEVAEQMDAIETDFGDNFQIGRVITIVEVRRPSGEVELRVRAGQYPWVSLGMLRFAQKVVEAQGAGGE